MDLPSRIRKWRLWAVLVGLIVLAGWWARTLPGAVTGRWIFDEGAYLQALQAANPSVAERFLNSGSEFRNPWMSELIVGRHAIAPADNPEAALFEVSFAVHHHSFNCDCPDIIQARSWRWTSTEGAFHIPGISLQLKGGALRVAFDGQLSGVGYPYRRQ